MLDGEIKNNGTSRYFKTAADALDRMPDYPSFMRELIAGTFTMDFNEINADGWRTIGTALNKQNLFSDSTEKKIGVETPDAAFAKIYELAAAAMSSASAGVRVVTGTYTGNGGMSKTITIGARPKAVLVVTRTAGWSRTSSTGTDTVNGRHSLLYVGQSSDKFYDNPSSTSLVRTYSVTETGLTISTEQSTDYIMNYTNYQYAWIAFV